LYDPVQNERSDRPVPDDVFEIMFSDLNQDAQQRFLKFVGIESAADGNYGIIPLAVIDRPVDNEYE
jgi:hypothetical protein